MNLIALIGLLISNKDAILQLLALIKELIAEFGNTAVALDVEAMNTLVAQKAQAYPAVAELCEAQGTSFQDLIRLILENPGAILELIRGISEIFR